jgi:hypothetical protein
MVALTAAKVGLGGGTVTSSPIGIDCGSTCLANFLSGSQVTLSATPAAGSVFAGWRGCSDPCTVSVSQAATVTATFRVDSPNPRMENISTRMQVLTGEDVMIAGFVIGGATSKQVAVVATGPSLSAYGIANPLANPTLRLVRSSDQAVIATNDDWQSAPNWAALQASSFAPTHPLEAALLVDLAPGAYTAIVEGAGGLTGHRRGGSL